jgi:hypothetical protein
MRGMAHMKSLHLIHEWLSINDAASFLSEHFGESFNEQRVFKLCVDGALPLSIYFPEPAVGIDKGESFSPIINEDVVSALRIIIDDENKVYAKAPDEAPGLFFGNISNMSVTDNVRDSIHNALSVIYDWYDKTTQTAIFHERYALEGCYNVPFEKNDRFYTWIRKLSISNNSPKFDSTGHVFFPLGDDFVEVIFRDYSMFRKPFHLSGVHDSCHWPTYVYQTYSQRKHEIYNPRSDEIYNMLVIQRGDLIDFINSVNDVMQQQEEIKSVNTPAYLDDSNEFYSQELAIAIEAHTAIFINNEGNTYLPTGKRIETWLQKHYPENCEKSDSFVKRIRTVVLPKKR